MLRRGVSPFSDIESIDELVEIVLERKKASRKAKPDYIDIDGDGDMDVLSANYNGNDVSWYRNNNGTGLTWSRVIINNQVPGARNVRTADVDDDAVLDIITTSVLDRTIAWQAGLGNGAFGPRQVISTLSTCCRPK